MLRTYLKYKPAWLQLVVFGVLALLISQLVVAISLPVIGKSYDLSLKEMIGILEGDIKHPDAKIILTIFQTLQFFVLFLIPCLLFAYFADPDPSKFLGLDRFPKTNFFLLALALIVVGTFAVGLLGFINKIIPLPQKIIDMETKQNAAVETLAVAKNIKDLVLSIILVGLFAAIGEELFFRAVLQRIFIQWTKSPWVGIIITSIIFSAIHMQFSGFLPRFGLGLILGALYWYSGSLWPGILFHFLYNSLGVILVYLNPKSLQQEAPVEMTVIGTWLFGLASVFAVGYLILQLKKQSTTDYAAIYPDKKQDFFA
jgi:membrane protease YdiL (CAAX protease family)